MTTTVYAKIYWPRSTDDPTQYWIGYYTSDGNHGNKLIEAASAYAAITRFWEITGYQPIPEGMRYR